MRRRGGNPKAELLGLIPLFEGVSRKRLERFALVSDELDVAEGKVLCQEGRAAREFFVIVEGEAEVTKQGQHVRRLGPGDFFGGAELVEHTLRATTVTALTPLRLLVFSSRGFWSFMHENPDLECKVLHALVLENVAVRKIAESALRQQAALNAHQALHDPLTGLPNRTLFRDRVAQALLACKRVGGRFAILVMDLDRFKEVNDTLGHHAGDSLLAELGARLERMLRESDTIARLGGDEFAVLLPGQPDPLGLPHVMERIRQAVEAPIHVQGLPLGIEASVGVAFYPEHGDDVDTLLQRADVAMYQAKAGHSFYAFYNAANDPHTTTRLTLLADLRRAMDNRELVLHFQPKASMRDGDVRSAEALVRWEHPERGLIPPDAFIPAVQHTGLIRPLTLYVIDEALRQCRAWLDAGLELSVSVNLSMRSLVDSAFPDAVATLLRNYDLGPSRLEIEITESTMLADPFRTRQVLGRLSAMGVRLSLDDFGTGYTSLSYLKRLPLDELKIDRSFVMNMLDNEDDAVIVRSTIDLARNLGLEVVAEGVETEATWVRLRLLGCDLAQGYYLTRPVPAADLEALLRRRAFWKSEQVVA